MISSSLCLLLWNLGGTEVLLIVLVLLLFFGGKKLPELAKGLGKGIREFKDAASGADEKKDDNKIEK